ncbi:MAG: glycerol-3-phosphate cytidylyltransferase [Aquificae bacterium]|nr:glycerol-3-phosphate cytidylyltransferase [Aquificota bacterium]
MQKKNGKVVITYGTFDLFHIGHLNLLRRAKELGDYLIVGVSTDEFNEIKGKKSVFPYEHRAKIVESIKYVDLVIPERNWEQKVHDIKKYNVDVFVIGDDWKGKFDYLKEYCEVVYLPRTEGISTTELKEALIRLSSLLEDDVLKVLEIITKGRDYLKSTLGE